jgi:hypothetical protein
MSLSIFNRIIVLIIYIYKNCQWIFSPACAILGAVKSSKKGENAMKKKKRLQRVSVVLASLLTLAMVQFIGSACDDSGGTSSTTTGTVAIFYDIRDTLPGKVYDCVDSGKHLDWDARGSKYQSYVVRAQDIWNGYKSGVIRPDSATILEDVLIEDVNSATLPWAGYTFLNEGKIQLNMNQLDDSTINPNGKYTLKIVAHELGHALGLAHNDSATTNIMKQGAYKNETLTVNDKASYDAAYSHY